jgi:hypothetical protein
VVGDGAVPGEDNPTGGQHINWQLNAMSLLSRWVFAGSSSALEEARVVESDATGKVFLPLAQVGQHSTLSGPSLHVLPSQGISPAFQADAGATASSGVYATSSSGSPALFCENFSSGPGARILANTATGNQIGNKLAQGDMLRVGYDPAQAKGGLALKVRGGSADNGALHPGGRAIEALGGDKDGGQPGAEAIYARAQSGTVPAIFCEANDVSSSGGVIKSQGNNSAIPIEAIQTGGRAPAIKASATATGANVSAPLVLEPHSEYLAGVGVDNGSVTIVEETHGSAQLHPFIHLNNRFGLALSGTPCFAKYGPVDKNTSASPGVWVDMTTSIQFDPNNGIPLSAGTVELVFSWTMGTDTTSSDRNDLNGHSLEVFDETSDPAPGGTPIVSIASDLVTSAGIGGTKVQMAYHYVGEYTLPDKGQRTFLIRHRKNGGADASVIELKNFQMWIRPRLRT